MNNNIGVPPAPDYGNKNQMSLAESVPQAPEVPVAEAPPIEIPRTEEQISTATPAASPPTEVAPAPTTGQEINLNPVAPVAETPPNSQDIERITQDLDSDPVGLDVAGFSHLEDDLYTSGPGNQIPSA